MNWSRLIETTNTKEQLLERLGLHHFCTDTSDPTEQDRNVAWQVLIELRTRISTQPLHFLDGDEGTALGSLYKLFQFVRDLAKDEGYKGQKSTELTIAVLNQIIRPFTAKWHRRKLAGDLDRDDACRELRGELRDVQAWLLQFERLLYAIACSAVPVDKKIAFEDRNVDLGPDIAFDKLLGLQPPMKGSDCVDEIVPAEKAEIENRRSAVGLNSGSNNLAGLAISGGGIRSATFALGVVQGLTRRGILRHIDILSTVSGGGYLGAFLSSVLNIDSPEHGPTEDKIPFRADVSGDSLSIRSLRNNSRYILPSNFFRWLSTLGQAIYGIVSNIIILSTLVLVAVLLTDLWMFAITPSRDSVQQINTGVILTTVCSIGGALLLFLPFIQRMEPLLSLVNRFGRYWAWTTIAAFCTASVLATVHYLPMVHDSYAHLVKTIQTQSVEANDDWSIASTFAMLVSFMTLVAARSQWLVELCKTVPRLGKLLFTLFWMAGPSLLVLAYFELCRVFVYGEHSNTWTISLGAWKFSGVVAILLVGSLAYSFFTNVNLTSLHRYYRNRLSETYIIKHLSCQNDLSLGERQPLSNLREDEKAAAPYHLINAALNLPSSRIAELRGRDCDFFLFSKHHCGSPVLGYKPTKHWEAGDPHLDLGTAVAISGAAAAPQMGMGSIRGASFLLTLLNVRLGYWLRNPVTAAKPSWWRRPFIAPGPGYLLREAFNSVNERKKYVNVSDGGHIENLGVYELLRRRSRFIIAIDGECDPDIQFPSLMRLQRFAAIDLGVKITMDLGRVRWQEVTEDQPSTKEDGTKKPRYSRGHYAVGRIDYPDDEKGWLIYIKLSVTGNEPDYVLDYRLRNPAFPHQSTGDQIFEEDQFEAYRQLGDHITEDLFSDELLSKEAIREAGTGQLSIDKWYQEVVNCFFKQGALDKK